MTRILKLTTVALVLTAGTAGTSTGQITAPAAPRANPDRFATLEDQLINRLRATTEQQRAYLRFLVRQVRNGRLDAALVVALERRAIRRNPQLPFPYFERVMRGEALKRRVVLPPVQTFATTRAPAPRQR